MFLVQYFDESKSWFPFSNLQRLSFSTESIYASIYASVYILYLLDLGFVILFYFPFLVTFSSRFASVTKIIIVK